MITNPNQPQEGSAAPSRADRRSNLSQFLAAFKCSPPQVLTKEFSSRILVVWFFVLLILASLSTSNLASKMPKSQFPTTPPCKFNPTFKTHHFFLHQMCQIKCPFLEWNGLAFKHTKEKGESNPAVSVQTEIFKLWVSEEYNLQPPAQCSRQNSFIRCYPPMFVDEIAQEPGGAWELHNNFKHNHSYFHQKQLFQFSLMSRPSAMITSTVSTQLRIALGDNRFVKKKWIILWMNILKKI